MKIRQLFFFKNCFWNTPWTTIRKGFKKIPHIIPFSITCRLNSQSVFGEDTLYTQTTLTWGGFVLLRITNDDFSFSILCSHIYDDYELIYHIIYVDVKFNFN